VIFFVFRINRQLKILSILFLASILFAFPVVPKNSVSAQTPTDYANAALQSGSVSTLVSSSVIRGDTSQFAIYTGSQALLTFSSSLVISNGLASGLSGPSLYGTESGNPDQNPTGTTTSLAAGTSVASGGDPSGNNANHVATLEMVLSVPANEATLSFSWSFCTDENPGSISYNDYFTAVIQNEGFGQNLALLPNGAYATPTNAAPYSNIPGTSTPDPNNVEFNACTAIQTTSVNVASLAGQNLVIDFTVGDGSDSVVNSAVILSSVGFGLPAPRVYTPPPSLVNANVTVFAPYSTPMILIQANVAINGKSFSSNFYEGAIAQLGMLPNGTYGYVGNYQSLFGAISGCQQGHSITITVSYNGITQSQTGTCPAPARTTTLNFTMTSST
jgi:hypothetical protein